MNRYSFAAIFIIATVMLASCMKPPIPHVIIREKILVDATKDGGGWWYPQSVSTGFSSATAHQGKKLADYLKSLGYKVDELPRGGTVSWSQLKQYTKVIRALGTADYSAAELLAYDSFLNRSSSLMLINDFMVNNDVDNLSAHLGLTMKGAIQGTITRFQSHAITQGVTSINFIMGSSVVASAKSSNLTVLGWLDTNDAAVMGILQHPRSRIFFIGDINGIEQLPQPFVGNVVKWLF